MAIWPAPTLAALTTPPGSAPQRPAPPPPSTGPGSPTQTGVPIQHVRFPPPPSPIPAWLIGSSPPPVYTSAGEPPAPTLQFGDPSGSAGHFSGYGHADRALHSSLLRTSEPVGHDAPTQTPPRFAKLDFATYDGTKDPLNWLNQCEQFFHGQRTLASERTWIASYHLRDAAQTWYYALEQDEGSMPPWERFRELCLLRFGPPIRGSRLAELGRLPFTSTVQDFADRFQALACHASGVTAQQRADLFVGGLPDHIRVDSEKLRRIEESKLSRKKELTGERNGLLPRSEVTNEEHPLSFGKSSLWNQYFQESEILEQIDRDVKRTHPDKSFFSAKSNQESLRRILIIFSRLYPSVRYVQGLNEVLAPLFYVLKNDLDTSNSTSAEADTFFCFVELISGFKNNYCKHLDNSRVGIRATLSKLSQLLKKHDEELWRHMEVITKVYPQYYAFRWITLLLTMEFSFNVCIHIWDAMLGDPEGSPDTLLRICCAMLILVRKRLLVGDFTANIQLLQHYPQTNIDHLLHIANRLRGTMPS
ncbi:uncharacterized protein LOC119339083 [Triticum dicoccoides]|uniref:uncharacterized protein LOC119339083 n=1 Tax=Triticum dicoccoides TaxID=85692 RepID=UPI0018919559|nr:uncharacterized protein LOC119339083 [Triticum dicoccoides]